MEEPLWLLSGAVMSADREGVSLDEELAPYGHCAYCGHEHRIGTCDVCGVQFDLEWEGKEFEDG